MILNCEQQVLTKALNIVSRAVSTRTTIPVLKGILLKAYDHKLYLSASDMDISIETNIDAVVEEEGEVVLNARLFSDIIRKLPAGNIFIEEEEDKNIFIKNSQSEFKIIGMSADEFPNIKEEKDPSKEMLFDKQMFCEMIRKTAFAASSEEAKGIITGVLIEITDEEMSLVALDGFRLAVSSEKLTNKENKNIIISAKLLNEVGKIISDIDREGDVSFIPEKKKAIVEFDDTIIIVRLMEGDFIKYRGIIPKSCSTEVIASRKTLTESIERAALLAKEGKNNLIRIELFDNEMTLTSRSEEGNVRETLMVDKKGDDLEIGFNSKYMMEGLKAIDEDTIRMEFGSSINPCLIKPVNGSNYQYLVLPVRLSSR